MSEPLITLVTTAPSLHESTRELASRLAARANAVLVFLHVVPLEAADGEAMLHSGLELATGETEAWLRRQRPSHASVPFRHRLESGDPELIVARFVEEHAVELLVAEQPPRAWLSELLWRSLAERLVRRVACPVVIGGPGFLRTKPRSVAPIRSPLSPNAVGELLNAMVEARVDALRSWMDRSAESVRRIADALTVQTLVAVADRTQGDIDRRLERRMAVELDEHQRALRAINWQLRHGERTWGRLNLHVEQHATLTAFSQRVDDIGRSTSLPLAIDDALERLVIIAGARVPGHDEGQLLMAFDANDDFLRILGQPGPLPSFETYAFDAEGLMLSNTRFPDHLLDAGLLTRTGQQTPLRLRVAEPSDGPAEAWPLTRMARAATGHHDGFDTRGYPDYRGTRVVGAWRWIEAYGFGVAAEVDHAAAYPG